MPTSYTDQFFTFDPANPPPGGSAVSFSVFSMTDQNDDDDLDRFNNDSVDGSDITRSWPGDTVTINVPGVGNVTYTGITFYLADGRRVFTPTDGQVLQNGTFVSSTFVSSQGPLDVSDLGPPCFVSGTRIETPLGPVAVEELRVGDVVSTRDNGPQEILWRGRRKLCGNGKFAPVVIRKGTLGNSRTLRVSQQHRILVGGWRCQLYLGEPEMLVAAKYLRNDDTIRIVNVPEVEYHHIMLKTHEILSSEGVFSESFNPHGKFARQDRAVCAEIFELFPELGRVPVGGKAAARPVMRRHEAQLLFDG